jgi:hypothetical protein
VDVDAELVANGTLMNGGLPFNLGSLFMYDFGFAVEYCDFGDGLMAFGIGFGFGAFGQRLGLKGLRGDAKPETTCLASTIIAFIIPFDVGIVDFQTS